MQIVKRAIFEYEETLPDLHKPIYVRQSVSGTGMKRRMIQLQKVNSILIGNHPIYVQSTGERYSRLIWCDTCNAYTERDEFSVCECRQNKSYNDE